MQTGNNKKRSVVGISASCCLWPLRVRIHKCPLSFSGCVLRWAAAAALGVAVDAAAVAAITTAVAATDPDPEAEAAGTGAADPHPIAPWAAAAVIGIDPDPGAEESGGHSVSKSSFWIYFLAVVNSFFHAGDLNFFRHFSSVCDVEFFCRVNTRRIMTGCICMPKLLQDLYIQTHWRHAYMCFVQYFFSQPQWSETSFVLGLYSLLHVELVYFHPW